MMHRSMITCVLALLICLFVLSGAVPEFTPPVFASTHTSETTVIVIATTLNVRAGPAISYKVIAQVQRGTVLVVQGQNDKGDWLNVRTPTQIVGWVSAQFVAAGGSTTTHSTMPAYAGQTFKPNSTISSDGYLYECFGSGDSPLRQIGPGTPVQVLGVGDFTPATEYVGKLGQGLFLKIRVWDGQFAWILAQNVQGDSATQPKVSGKCEDYDRIDWTKVVRPTPVPQYNYPPPSSGARCGAICNDGWPSSATGRGACSHHGGVRVWLSCP